MIIDDFREGGEGREGRYTCSCMYNIVGSLFAELEERGRSGGIQRWCYTWVNRVN